MQNFISTAVIVILGFSGAVSLEKLNWKLIKVWIPVNLIFIGMLVSGMYSEVVRTPMFWVAATASGVLGLAISFTSMWFLNQTGPTTYR
nr:GDP-mannose transporter GONST2-like isoform X1 [Ipomoea batatas]